jgi:hypothetical protein
MPVPKTLRRLAFEPQRVKLADAKIGDVSALYGCLAGLEDLSIKGASIALGKIQLPELRRFELKTRDATRSLVRAIATARWPKLERLVLDLGKRAGETTAVDFVALLDASATGSLVHLGLKGLPFSDDLVAALAASKMLRKLEALDLSRGTLTNAGARALVKIGKDLPRLEDIDLSGHSLARGVVEELRAAFGERLIIDDSVDDATEDDEDDEDDDEPDDEARHDDIVE